MIKICNCRIPLYKDLKAVFKVIAKVSLVEMGVKQEEVADAIKVFAFLRLFYGFQCA